MRVTKLLALGAVAVAAVACNGISPTAPDNATVASEEATSFAGAKAVNGPVDGSVCRDITAVKLQVLRSPGGNEVEAIYLRRGQPTRCQVAPLWSSTPRGRLVATRDPFIVRFTRTRPATAVLVIAEAPNGIRGSLRVQ